MMTCVHYETFALAVRLSTPGDAFDRTLAALETHRAGCYVCQTNQDQAREHYRKITGWQTIALRPPCPGGHDWSDYGGIWFCQACGVVRV